MRNMKNMKFSRLKTSSLLAVVAAGALCGAASGGPLLPGNLAVDRVGDGTQTLANTGNSQFVDQYTPAGVLVNSNAIPDSGSGSLLVSGTASSEGALTRSGDGSVLVVAGYNTARPYTASLTSSTSASVQRGFGSLDALGNYGLAASTNSQYSANNVRTGTMDAAGGNVFGGGAANGTVMFAGNGAAGQAGTAIQTANTNTRVANILNGNLYYSTGNGTAGVYGFAGVPTSAATPTVLVATGAGSSPYDFAVSPGGGTVYVADDRATAAGGVQRWDLVNGTYSLSYTLGTGAANIGARGLAVDFSGPAPSSTPPRPRRRPTA